MFFVYLYKMGMGWVQGPFQVSTKEYFNLVIEILNVWHHLICLTDTTEWKKALLLLFDGAL
jgi:hypothetical protein